MIVDHRTYDVIPGELENYVGLYKSIGWPVQRHHLGNCLGWYVSTDIGELNRIVHLWGFESLQDRAERRAGLAADPEWTAFRVKAAPLLRRMRNTILTPVDLAS